MLRKTLLACIAASTTLGCGGPEIDPQPEPSVEVGSTGAYLSTEHYSETDVVGFHFVVERVACADEAEGDFEPIVIEANVDLMAGLMPGMVEVLEQRLDAQSKHVGADLFISLAPGCYDVTAVPASHIEGDAWRASAECAAARLMEPIEVLPGETAEPPLMISQCEGDPTAQLDTPVALNRPPMLEIALEDDKFAYECSPVTVCATVADPDDDPIEVVWDQREGPAPFSMQVGPLTPIDFEGGRRIWQQCATMTNRFTGEYGYQVTAYDLGRLDGEAVRMEQLTGEDSHITTAFPLYVDWVEERRCIDEDGALVPVDESAVVERAEGCDFTTAEEYYCGEAYGAEHPDEAGFLCPDGALDIHALYPLCD